MDASILASIAAGIGVIGVMAYCTLPRAEDYFELEMAELAFYTASGVSPQRPGRAACEKTSDDHLPECGHGDIVESSESPPPIPGSDPRPPDGPEWGGRAVLPIQGAPVFHLISGDGPTVPVQRDRPVLLRVK